MEIIMNKDAYYFSHDSNARNDQRLMRIRMKYGMEGYGIYFATIEILREAANYTLELKDIPTIAYDLKVDLNLVEEIIFNYDLFIIDEKLFYSSSLKRRMERLDNKREKLSKAGRKGGKASAKVKHGLTIAKPLNKSKVNKSKVNNIKERYDDFKQTILKDFKHIDSKALNDFIDYWSEPNKSNTKMKFELQQTFHIGRRLKRWANNDYSSNKNDLNTELAQRSQNAQKESKKLLNYIKKAESEAQDFVPDLNALRRKN
jgi:general stress protein YciG